MELDDDVTENMLSIMESGGTFYLLEQLHNLEKIINYCYMLKENDSKEIEKLFMSLQNYRDKKPIEIAILEAIVHIENITSEITQSNMNITENRQNLNTDNIKLENDLTGEKNCDKLEHFVRELETQNKNLTIELTDFKTRFIDISSDLEQQMDEGFRLRTEVNKFMENEKQFRMTLANLITHTGFAAQVNEMTMQEMISTIHSNLIELNLRLPDSSSSIDDGKINVTVQVEKCKPLETIPSIVKSIDEIESLDLTRSAQKQEDVVSQCDKSMETDNMWIAAFMNIEHTIDEALHEYEFSIPIESLPETGMGEQDSSRDRSKPIVIPTNAVSCASVQNILSLEHKLDRLVSIITSLLESRNTSRPNTESTELLNISRESVVATVSEQVVDMRTEWDALTSQHNALLLRNEEIMSLYAESEFQLSSLKSLVAEMQSENCSLKEQLADKSHELDQYSLQVETFSGTLASHEDRFGREMAAATVLLEDRDKEVLILRGELKEVIQERDALTQHHDQILKRLELSLELCKAKATELASAENLADQLRLENSELTDKLASCTAQLVYSNNDLLSRSVELETVRNTLSLTEERFIQETESLTSTITMKEQELVKLNDLFQQSLREKEIVLTELKTKYDILQVDLNERISHVGSLSDENEILKLQIEEKDGLIQNLEVDLDQKCEKIMSLDEHLMDLKSKISNSELEYRQRIDELNSEVLEIISLKKQLLIEKELLDKKITELEGVVSNHEYTVKDLSGIRNKLVMDLSKVESELSEALVQLEQNRQIISSNELLITNLNNELSNNQTELDSVNDLLRVTRSELERMTVDSRENASRCELLEGEMVAIRTLMDNKEALVKSKDEKIDDLNRQLVTSNNEVNELKFRCEPISRLLGNEQVESDEEKETLRSQCRTLTISLSSSQQECKFMKQKALTANQNLTREKKNFNLKIKALESQVETLEARLITSNTSPVNIFEENVTLKRELEQKNATAIKYHEEEIKKMKLEIEKKAGIIINQEKEMTQLKLEMKNKNAIIEKDDNTHQSMRQHYDQMKERYKLKRIELNKKDEEINLLKSDIVKLTKETNEHREQYRLNDKLKEEINVLKTKIERYRVKLINVAGDKQSDSLKNQIDELKTNSSSTAKDQSKAE